MEGTDTESLIQKTYEQENIKLLEENKHLREQLKSGETDVKRSNAELRKKIIELENQIAISGDIVQLQEEYDAYVKQSKAEILNLKQQNHELEIELQKCRQQCAAKQETTQNTNLQWDADEEQNNAINHLIQNLLNAYKRQSGTEEALSQLAAIIDPECIVSAEKPQKGTVQPASKQTKIPVRGETPVREVKKPVSRPKPVIQQSTNMRTKELESKIEELTKKLDEANKENTTLKNRNKEKIGKQKEMQSQLDEANTKLLESQKQHQIEVGELQVKVKTMEAELKILQGNADYRAECEELKVKVASLEAQNQELLRPKSTGDPKSDRVLDAIMRMESDIRQRQLALTRLTNDIEEQWETEKRTIEKIHKRELEEKNVEIQKVKEEIADIQAQLSAGERRRK